MFGDVHVVDLSSEPLARGCRATMGRGRRSPPVGRREPVSEPSVGCCGCLERRLSSDARQLVDFGLAPEFESVGLVEPVEQSARDTGEEQVASAAADVVVTTIKRVLLSTPPAIGPAKLAYSP